MAQSSWCEWVKIVPLAKVNTPGSSTMLQVPPGEKSIVRTAWKEPGPIDRLLVASPTTVDCASEHASFRHVKEVNCSFKTARCTGRAPVPARAGAPSAPPATTAVTTAGRTIAASKRRNRLILWLLPGPAAQASEAAPRAPGHAQQRAERPSNSTSPHGDHPLRATALWPGAGHIVQPQDTPQQRIADIVALPLFGGNVNSALPLYWGNFNIA
jgi:hypothetical protein